MPLIVYFTPIKDKIHNYKFRDVKLLFKKYIPYMQHIKLKDVKKSLKSIRLTKL